MKKPLFLSALCVIVILCLNSICYSQYLKRKISTNPYDDYYPRISNNGHVVWEGYDGTDWEIFLYDGTTVIQLTNNSYEDFSPRVNDKGYVVWQGYPKPDGEIFLYNGATTVQLTDNSYEDVNPEISNDGYVVWQGCVGDLGNLSDSEIFLYDGSNTVQLTNNSYDEARPQISNSGYVVWTGYDSHNVSQVFLYDGVSVTQLTEGYVGNRSPRVNDNGHVVWEGEDYTPGIYLYNGTGIIELAVERMYENVKPAINNAGHVVWIRQPAEGGRGKVMLFDGTTKVQLTNNLDYEDAPTINSKGEIAWTQNNASGSSIILYDGSEFTELTNKLRSAWGPGLNDHGSAVYEGWSGTNSDIYIASPVSVISPDGGEVVPSGLASTIRWAGPAQAVKYKVKYSVDNGLTWNKAHQKPYVTGTTLDWNVPVPPANRRKCLVKVVGFDVSGTAVSRDQSDAAFMIEVLRLTSPNGGEPPMTSGGQHTITWTTNATVAEVRHIVLSYTLNNGLSWKKINTSADSADDGSFIWNVPDVAHQKDNCKVKIVLKDSSGNTVGSDLSDGVFTIQPKEP